MIEIIPYTVKEGRGKLSSRETNVNSRKINGIEESKHNEIDTPQ